MIALSIEEVVKAMDDVASSFSGTVDLTETLTRITASAVAHVPAAEHASISVRRADGAFETLAPTSPLVVELDTLQYQLHEGPCFEAVSGGPTLTSGSVGTDSRWPRYGPAAASLGLRSQLAVLLSDGSETLALNVYSTVADSLEDEDGLIELFTIYVRLVLGHAHTAERWATAIDSRTLIGQATGLVMAKYRLTPTAAFDFLIRISQNTNTKLRTVAADIVLVAGQHAERQRGGLAAPSPEVHA